MRSLLLFSTLWNDFWQPNAKCRFVYICEALGPRIYWDCMRLIANAGAQLATLSLYL